MPLMAKSGSPPFFTYAVACGMRGGGHDSNVDMWCFVVLMRNQDMRMQPHLRDIKVASGQLARVWRRTISRCVFSHCSLFGVGACQEFIEVVTSGGTLMTHVGRYRIERLTCEEGRAAVCVSYETEDGGRRKNGKKKKNFLSRFGRTSV